MLLACRGSKDAVGHSMFRDQEREVVWPSQTVAELEKTAGPDNNRLYLSCSSYIGYEMGCMANLVSEGKSTGC